MSMNLKSHIGNKLAGAGIGLLCALALLAGSVGDAYAQAGTTAGMPKGKTCHDSGFLSKGKIVTDFCWECIFPMKIFGVTVPVGKRNANKLPSATASPVCVCPGRFGLPSVGATLGYWSPDHAIELVNEPFCSPVLFGETLISSDMDTFKGIMARTNQGSGTKSKLLKSGGSGTAVEDTGDGAAVNAHWIKIPTGYFTSFITSTVCAGGGNMDFDFGYFSEIDPSWSSDAIALYTHPEARVFAKMYATAVCMADAVATNVRKPMAQASWCVGSWGQLYPHSGRSMKLATISAQGLAGSRVLAKMHRFGLAKLKYGNSAVCKDRRYFLFPKQQYQFQNIWPRPIKNDAMWLGSSALKWGNNRTIPVVGEDRLFIEFGYQECCITAW